MLDGECMGTNPVVSVDYGDGHYSITFAPLHRVVDSNAYSTVRLIASIRSNTILIGYTIFRYVLLARALEARHRKS
jgi:hypothetical protein